MVGTLQALIIAAAASRGAGLEVLVTGATGGTGAAVYRQLKAQGVGVRAFVRNASKAREILGCHKCDPSEGIFVGDVTAEDPLAEAAKGVDALAIVTSAIPICKSFSPPDCYYPTGEYPVDVDFHGGKNQVASFVKANGGKKGQVVLCSSSSVVTTDPDAWLDKIGHGDIGFFKLNFETVLASAGLPYTIVKPCRLIDTPAGTNELIVGHEVDLKASPFTVSRQDVARVMTEAFLQPEAANGLRFDLCSREGPVTTDFGKLFADARYPWQQAVAPAAPAASEVVV